MRIHEFVWPQAQIEHIGEQHGVTAEEFEEVCKGKSLFIRVPSEGESAVYNVYGQTRAGRYLFCVVIRLADTKGYPISARAMTDKEKRAIAAGESDEENKDSQDRFDQATCSFF